jgi:DNA-binding Lrp family transcriptional regulator
MLEITPYDGEMRDSDTVDETDLAIIHAVERSPRGAWATLAAVIGIDAATAARRWQRLEDSGTAWVTCYPLLAQAQVTAILELTCIYGQAATIAGIIANDPQALFVDLTTGRSDVFVTVHTESAEALSDYLLNRLAALPGVTGAHTHPVVTIHAESGFAAGGALDPSALSKLPHTGHGRIVGSRSQSDDLDWAICTALSRSGRATLSELSALTGISDVSVRRRMDKLLEQGALRMMVEIAAHATASPVTVWYRARVMPKFVLKVVEGISARSNIKAVVSVAGPDNLIFKATFPHVSFMAEFEAELNHDLPRLEITDRNIVIRPIRLMGRLVDARGYATGFAPVDIREQFTA